MKEWLRRYWYWVVGAVVLVTAGVLISIFRSYWFCEQILNFFDDWSVALSAGAAVILAVAAFRTIREANAREKRRMEEEQRKQEEDRELDFKRRSLSEINDWAEEVIQLVDKFQRGYPDTELTELFDRKLILKTKAINIESVSPEFKDYFRVRVEKSIKDFDAFDEEFKKERWDSLQEKAERCKNSFINLLESVAYLKAELKL